MFEDLSHMPGPFDIIGDVHGCFDELCALLETLGYHVLKEQGTYTVSHPQKRQLIFVGDLVDRGPKTPEVLRLVMAMVNSTIAYCVKGNHDDKLTRKLQGRNVMITNGLAESLEQLEAEPQDFKEEAISFLSTLKYYYIFDNRKLAVSHAGLREEFIGKESKKIQAFCLYGQTTNQVDAHGLPVRIDWAKEYKGETLIVYGHSPLTQTQLINNTINIDLGCVFGGHLAAFRYPEKTLVQQPAFKKYCAHKDH